jgi:hypothetical protein
MDKLSVTQATVYEALKIGIREGLDSGFKTGEMLIRVRDEKLYRDEYDTFQKFCEAEFNLVKQRAYQYIQAAEVRKALPAKSKQLLTNESQARELAKVPEEDRKTVLAEAAKDGPVTAQKIAEAAKPAKPAEKVIDLDKNGAMIPEHLLEDWRRASKIAREAMGLLSELKCSVEKAQDEKDIVYAATNNSLIADLQNAYNGFKSILPEYVCPACHGKTSKTCRQCRRRGFLDKFSAKTVPEEVWKLARK